MTTTRSTTETAPASPNTTTQASLYQRLRGHLAVLKLHDAAEALPTVLDRAQADGTSMTAALEELLSIEVAATEARRLAGRLRFACLPTPARLEDFDYDAAPGLDRNLIGIPSENYGFSRDARGKFGPPDFTDAAIDVRDETMAVTIKLR